MSQYATTFAQLSDGLIYSRDHRLRIGAAGLLGRGRSTGHRQARAHPARRRRLGAVGTAFTVLAVALNVGSTVTCGLAAQRIPWGNMYEFVIVFAAALGVTYLVFLTRRPVRVFGVWVVAIVLLGLGLAVTVLYAPVSALVPGLNSYWLIVHVAAVIIAGGVFTIGAIATARPAPSWPKTPGPVLRLGPQGNLGVHHLVLYAAYLHAQATAGWKGVKASWFGVAGLPHLPVQLLRGQPLDQRPALVRRRLTGNTKY